MNSGKLWIVAVVVLACGIAGFAQNNPNTDQGMKPFDSFHGGALDSVSITSGNLVFHVPFYSLPQRGRVGLNFSMLYNNKGFRLQTSCPPPPQHGCTNTWHFVGKGITVVDDEDPVSGVAMTSSRVDTGAQDGFGDEVFATVYSAVTVDGSIHQLADTGNGYRSIDGSGILWNSSANTSLDRGGMYFGGLQAEDPNGNSVTDNLDGSRTDTLGRSIPAIPVAPNTSTASLASCPQLNLPFQPVTFAYTWNLPGPTGSSPFLLCYASVFIRTAFFGSSYTNTTFFHDVSQSFNMLQSIVLPNGTAWTFTYDGANPNDTTSLGYGDLVKVGFPIGGSLSYTYATLLGYQGAYYTNLMTQKSRSVMTRTLDANDGTGPHQWSYNWENILAATSTTYTVENKVTDPLLNDTVHVVSGLFGGTSLFETQTRFYQGSEASGTLLKTVNTDYSYSSNPFDTLSPIVTPPTAINVMPIRVTTIWPNGQTSKVETDYDSAFTFRDPTWGLPIYPPESRTSATYAGTLGTVAARREYDYGSGGAGPLLNQTFTIYLWQGNSNYLSANMLDLPSAVTVQNGAGNLCAETDTLCDETAPTTPSPAISMQHTTPPAGVRGNPTTTTRKLTSTPCQSGATWTNISSHTAWFDTGEVQSSTDPLGHTTTHLYDSANYGAYPTQTCSPSTNNGTVTHCVSGTYDFNSGLIKSFTDENIQTSNFTYDSMFRMLTAVGPADPSGLHPETDFTFPTITSVQRSKKQDSTHWIVDSATFDGFGRTSQTHLTDPEGDDFVDTTYDQVGRASTVSNPHRSTSSPTDGTTTTFYDALGRVTQVTKQDGSASTISYAGSCTTTTDEAGKQRKTCSDALDRLTQVFEDPAGLNYETDYQYDVLNNLLRVDQKGSAPTDSSQWRTRLFTYDSLSRLLTASNPESGIITYTYDADSNLLQKTSPAPNILPPSTATQPISYCYDELHRVTKRDYSPHTFSPPACPITAPVVSYTYDSGTNAKGHLTSMTDQAGTATYAYDTLGREASETRPIAGISKSTSYIYDLTGTMTSLTYPSGRVVTYAANTAGRLLSATDGNGTQYVGNATHYPSGAEYQRFMPGIYFRNDLNPRLQVSGFYSDNGQISSFFINKTYSYGAAHQNNGNVMSITNNKDGNRTQTFTYDSLNRITAGWSSANTGSYSWGENYTIDAWGNLQVSQMSGKASGGNFTLSATVQNQPTGFGFDAAGNLMSYLSATYTYDPENRMASTSGMSYTYDGNGERVLKSQTIGGAAVKRYWSMGGNTLAESDGTGNLTAEYVYFGGKRVARIDLPAGSVHYYLSDHLKSTSMVVSAAGIVEEESDYSSFGTEYPITGTGVNHYKFTGTERDSESSMDFMQARYYSSVLGRFTQPDPLIMQKQKLLDPQQWNMYQYARNNPLEFMDPKGLYVCKGSSDQCAAIKTGLQNAQKAADKFKEGSKERTAIEKMIKAYGAEGEKNGVTVKFGNLKGDAWANTDSGKTFFGKLKTTITFDMDFIKDDVGSKHGNLPAEIAGSVAHEGTHMIDGDNVGGRNPNSREEEHATELNAFHVQADIFQGLGVYSLHQLWDPGLPAGENKVRSEEEIDHRAQETTDDWCKDNRACK